MKLLSSLLIACCTFSAACVAEDVSPRELSQSHTQSQQSEEPTAVEVGEESTAALKEDIPDPTAVPPGAGSIVIQDTNCGSWPGNGIADHDVKSRTVSYGGRTVRIALVNQRFSDHSFAAVRSGYVGGDQTWVDRSYDGACPNCTTWSQCGPFNSQFSNDLLNISNWMRACVRFNGGSFCTDWYFDKP